MNQLIFGTLYWPFLAYCILGKSRIRKAIWCQALSPVKFDCVEQKYQLRWVFLFLKRLQNAKKDYATRSKYILRDNHLRGLFLQQLECLVLFVYSMGKK